MQAGTAGWGKTAYTGTPKRRLLGIPIAAVMKKNLGAAARGRALLPRPPQKLTRHPWDQQLHLSTTAITSVTGSSEGMTRPSHACSGRKAVASVARGAGMHTAMKSFGKRAEPFCASTCNVVGDVTSEMRAGFHTLSTCPMESPLPVGVGRAAIQHLQALLRILKVLVVQDATKL
mmetsp:Transcript_58959/g.121898  ORF Transcript_58959/g.121898 Transcript_58959/m.121898 type:complete len:175 (+) Transcript_58959:230-754(+)